VRLCRSTYLSPNRHLPSYLPDFNPIEEAFCKIKTLVRKAARTHDVVAEALGATSTHSLSLFLSSKECSCLCLRAAFS
jgi:transposase